MLQNLATSRPPRWGDLHAGDTDTRAGSFQPDMTALSDGIVSVLNVSIARVDGIANRTTDLQLAVGQQPQIDTTNQIVTLWLCAPSGAANSDYIVTLTIKTTAGRTISRDVYQFVSPLVG